MKKRILLVVGLLLVAFLPSAARAQVAGYDKGFFIKNEDDTFKVKFTGRVQTKFFYEKDPTRSDPAAGGNPGVKSQYASFQMRRAQLGVNASYDEYVQAGFVLKHATASAANNTFQTVNITSAIAAVEFIPEFVVAVGMVGLPLDMMSEMSSAWFLLTEAPITNTQDDGVQGLTVSRSSFGVPDGLGVNFSGGYWKWFYSASVVNGAESNYAINPNRRFSAGFRTGFNILDPVPGSMTDFECSSTPKLTVSAGTMYQTSRTDPNTNAWIKYLWTSSLGVGFRWGGFALTTEGYYRKTSIPNPVGGLLYYRNKLTDIGYYAAAGYYAIPKKLEIAGQAGQIIRQGPDNNSYQFGGGLNYYAFDNNLKLQLAYTLTADFDATPTVAGAAKVHNIALMATAIF